MTDERAGYPARGTSGHDEERSEQIAMMRLLSPEGAQFRVHDRIDVRPQLAPKGYRAQTVRPPRLALLGVLVAALAAAGCGGAGGAASYLKANERILRSLPVFPGAVRLETRSSPYFAGDAAGSPVAGYTTLARYRLPAGTSAGAVAGFYSRRLVGWQLVERIGGPVLNFRRDAAMVSVNLESARVLELAVDHASFGKLGRSSAWAGGTPQLIAFRVTTGARARYDLVLAQTDGRVLRIVVGESHRPSLEPALFQRASWSPNGRRIAFTLDRGRGQGRLSSPTDVYAAEAGGSRLRRLTESGLAFAPVWSPDGRSIAYAQRERGARSPLTDALWVMRSDGSGERKLAPARDGQVDLPGSWSPDGRLLAFTRTRYTPRTLSPRSAILAVRPDGSGLRIVVLRGADPAYSPDGRRLAFVSDRDRNGELSYGDRSFFANELYVAAADGSRPRRLTQTRLNERAPAWSPDGRRLAFQRGRVTGNAEATEVLVADADGTHARRLLSDPSLRTWWALPAWRP